MMARVDFIVFFKTHPPHGCLNFTKFTKQRAATPAIFFQFDTDTQNQRTHTSPAHTHTHFHAAVEMLIGACAAHTHTGREQK